MNTEDRSVEFLALISERLGQLVALTAANQIVSLNQKEAVEKLGTLGFSAGAISDITGFPTSSVGPALSRAKTKNQKKP